MPFGQERGLIPVIGVAAADHVDAHVDILGAFDLHRQAEAVQKLWPKLPLLGVAGADQNEARGMADRQALPFHDVLARLRHVEQQVDEVILQEVHLVDIEVSPVGAGQEAGLERLFAVGQRLFDVERADDAVFGGPERQVDDGRRFLDHRMVVNLRPVGHVLFRGRVHRAPATARIGGNRRRARARRWISRCPGRRTPERPRCRGRWRSGSWRVSSRPGPRWRRTGKARSVFWSVILRLPRSGLSCVVRAVRQVRCDALPLPSTASTRKRA
jgi:hypothetical protein